MKKPGITIRKTVGIILMAAVVLADFLMLDVFASPLDKALICPGIDQDALENAREKGLRTAEEIEAEGIVLLENNGTLPFLEETEKINLLGFRSYYPIYGGTGSGGSSYTDNRISLVEALETEGMEINPH